jgi:hypothetical protein
MTEVQSSVEQGFDSMATLELQHLRALPTVSERIGGPVSPAIFSNIDQLLIDLAFPFLPFLYSCSLGFENVRNHRMMGQRAMNSKEHKFKYVHLAQAHLIWKSRSFCLPNHNVEMLKIRVSSILKGPSDRTRMPCRVIWLDGT